MILRRCVSALLVGLILEMGRVPVSAQGTETNLSGTLLHSRLTNGTWQIWQTDLVTRERAQLTYTPGDKRRPGFASNSQITYCTSNQACFKSRLEDATAEPLFSDLWPVRDAVFSPDGTRMAFSRFRTDLVDSANLWVASADGTDRRMITHEAGIQEHPAWSPDGRWLAYSGGQGYGTYEIYVVGAEGAGRRQLTENSAHDFLPAWSPDGSQIAFSSDVTGDYEIWLVRADGLNLTQLTQAPGLDTSPAWSPDGKWIAFATNRSGELELWVMQKDGSDEQLLEKADGGVCDPAWRL